MNVFACVTERERERERERENMKMEIMRRAVAMSKWNFLIWVRKDCDDGGIEIRNLVSLVKKFRLRNAEKREILSKKMSS